MLNIFDITKNDIYCNTSYPLKKELWEEYKSNIDLFKNDKDMSLYIHIPFCNNLCKFCEYTRFKKRNSNDEKLYLQLLNNQINDFFKNHIINKIYGFDIGGGTPTVLADENFEILMKSVSIIESKVKNHVFDYEKSIESSFNTINEFKIKQIVNAGFYRISLGVQTASKDLLINNKRYNGTIDDMKTKMKIMKELGIKKINLDFMYGLNSETNEDILATINLIKILNPEQVTLYEMRYNMVNQETKITKDKLYEQYMLFYKELIKIGYKGKIGQNTFSKFDDDGVSSYLRYRMKQCMPYKGFGISAQSMSSLGVSYNVGKGETDFLKCIENNSIYEKDIYELSPEELVAKYIAISLYYGEFNINVMSKLLKNDASIIYKNELNYLIKNKLVTINNKLIKLTNEGFKYYGAIGSLFYSNKHKQYLIGSEKL